jgi:hypothetical protein
MGRSSTLSFAGPTASSNAILLLRRCKCTVPSCRTRGPPPTMDVAATVRSSAAARSRPLSRLATAPPVHLHPTSNERAPGAGEEVREGERKMDKDERGKPMATCVFHANPTPNVCCSCIDSTLVMPCRQKGHLMAFWTCGAHLDNFRDPKIRFKVGGPI